MSTIQHESVGNRFPDDNVQHFERVRDYVQFLQDMADLDEDEDTLNQLAGQVETDRLCGLPVRISGGLIQVHALDEETMSAKFFVKHTGYVEGEYRGLSWRYCVGGDEATTDTWQLCHVVTTGSDTFLNDEGDEMTARRNTFVTAANSDVLIIGAQGSHDYRLLQDDHVALVIDQLVFGDREPNNMLKHVAKLFPIVMNTNVATPESVRRLQRLSYANELGLFRGMEVMSPVGYKRSALGFELFASTEGDVNGYVMNVGFDFPVCVDETGDYDFDQTRAGLCLEVQMQDHGHISVPYMPGATELSHSPYEQK